MKFFSIVAVLIMLAPVFLFGSALPRLVSAELPMYPEQARTARVAGTVRISFVITQKGRVENAEVVSGNPLLRDAALASVRTWIFRPAELPNPSPRYETEFIYALGVQDRPGQPRLTVSMQDFRRIEVSSELYVEAVP